MEVQHHNTLNVLTQGPHTKSREKMNSDSPPPQKKNNNQQIFIFNAYWCCELYATFGYNIFRYL